MPDLLADKLSCPECLGSLRHTATLSCSGCGARYDVRDGIPVLAPRNASPGQASFFDEEVDPGFEIERPRGAPRLYGWLLEYKIRRSLDGVGPLAGRSVLTVCGGSGMDAEFLASAGAYVVSMDISIEACRRARERARRRGLEIQTVVADAARLPFPDRAFDVVYVHDGLHHLEDPLAGLVEMARVARTAVSLTEPARAAVTRLAILLGVAGEFEEAGNRVARVQQRAAATALECCGFAVVRCARYGMFYRHHPGWAVRAFSARGLFALACATVHAGNALGGRFGNKLTVQAVRLPEAGVARCAAGSPLEGAAA